MKWYCFAIAIPILGMTGCVKNFDARDLTNKKVEGCANTSIPSQMPLEFADITYDSRGNKVRPGVTYDSSVNPFQTNYVWMFIFNDFSQNNPSRDGLNAYIVYSNFDRRGLPQTLAEGFPPYATPELFTYDYNRMQIHYACDEGGGGKKW